ncbi:Hsp20/alpha crystallin family protein [Actinospongicola halichondriae]|uniref:Hsp20/alpha crystallin family protein n=1 Tax=Actinospongicola halichondriae TaxID=3236844 RepID=UPI003D45D547
MLLRFDPFRELDRLAEQTTGTARRSVMAMDAVRSGDEVTVHFDLPGVDRDTIEVTVEKNQLVVRAERRWNGSDDVDVLASERPHGTFTRSLFLGENLDTERIDADYVDGVLVLTIPVAEVAKPRKITVGTGQAALAS